jgi:hypothetical protein
MVFDGLGLTVLHSFYAYSSNFPGGVRVAAGDVDGDGFADVVTGAGAGGGPHVMVYSGSDLSLLRSFMALAPFFLGGVFVAAGDVDGDGRSDVIVGAGEGGEPLARVFSGQTGSLLNSFFAFDANFRGGVRVAAGDGSGDGRADIISGSGSGAGPHVKVFDAVDLHELDGFLAFDPAFFGGVFVG